MYSVICTGGVLAPFPARPKALPILGTTQAIIEGLGESELSITYPSFTVQSHSGSARPKTRLYAVLTVVRQMPA